VLAMLAERMKTKRNTSSFLKQRSPQQIYLSDSFFYSKVLNLPTE